MGFNAATGLVEPEPGAGLETALMLQITVESDLEPEWTLVSPRAQAAGRTRNLNWADRTRIAPARLGVTGDMHLTWRRGSVLTKLTDGKTDAAKELTRAAREMRDTFDQKGPKELDEPLKIVAAAARDMGVPVGAAVQALIDAGSVTFTGGTISLHDEEGVPLRALGLGSSRLLIAALQRQAADKATTFLIDELEYGLEPHRIIRLLGALGAKEELPPLQVFATSHSPIAVAELNAHQLHIVRGNGGQHTVSRASDAGDVQGTIRAHAHALLASSIVVCEGGSEIGLMRGLDQHFTATGEKSLAACGATLVNGNGDARKLMRLAVIGSRGDNKIFLQRGLELDRLVDLRPNLFLRQFFAVSLQFALDADILVRVTIPHPVKINTILPLPASCISLDVGILQEPAPQRHACPLEGLFVGWFRDLSCGQ